jgi:hypothetical protein
LSPTIRLRLILDCKLVINTLLFFHTWERKLLLDCALRGDCSVGLHLYYSLTVSSSETCNSIPYWQIPELQPSLRPLLRYQVHSCRPQTHRSLFKLDTRVNLTKTLTWHPYTNLSTVLSSLTLEVARLGNPRGAQDPEKSHVVPVHKPLLGSLHTLSIFRGLCLYCLRGVVKRRDVIVF